MAYRPPATSNWNFLMSNCEVCPDIPGRKARWSKKSGLRQPIRWRGKQNLKKFDHPIRIRVSYVGLRPEDARVYAVYLTEK